MWSSSATTSATARKARPSAWRDTKGQKRAKHAIKDALLADVGWVKVYYDYKEDTDTRDVPKAALEAQILELFGANLSDVTEEQVAAAVESGDLKAVEEVTVVMRDRVCIDYVPWDLIRYDPTARQIEDMRWVAQYTVYPEHEVKNNPAWREFAATRYGARKGPKMLDDLSSDSHASSGTDYDANLLNDFGEDEEGDDDRITIIEMWDFETGLVTVYPKDHDDLVLHQRMNPLMFNLDLEDRNPFKPLIVRDDPDNFEGLGDMRVIFPGLEELDEYRSNQATYVARTIPKFFGPQDALDNDGKEKFKSPVWGEFVPLAGGHGKDSIGQVQIPSLPQEAYQIPEQVQAEMKEATGVNEPMRGVFPSKRTTATETQIVTGKGEERQSERRGALADWYIAIARTAMQLMQVFYDQERMMRFTDDLGQEFEWHWNKEDIALDADLKIAITPVENLTRDQRIQRAIQYMNLALPLPETDRGELMKFVAREMGLRDDLVRSIVKSDQEVQMEQQAQQIGQLAVSPQQHAGAPPGLSITPH
jgi:hypothetical protein